MLIPLDRRILQEQSLLDEIQQATNWQLYHRRLVFMSKFVIVESLMFPCPKCGHANRPAAQKLKSVKLYLLDKLPPCRKCGWELKSRNYDQSKISDRLMKRARKELEEDGLLNTEPPKEHRTPAPRRFIAGEDGTKIERL